MIKEQERKSFFIHSSSIDRCTTKSTAEMTGNVYIHVDGVNCKWLDRLRSKMKSLPCKHSSVVESEADNSNIFKCGTLCVAMQKRLDRRKRHVAMQKRSQRVSAMHPPTYHFPPSILALIQILQIESFILFQLTAKVCLLNRHHCRRFFHSSSQLPPETASVASRQQERQIPGHVDYNKLEAHLSLLLCASFSASREALVSRQPISLKLALPSSCCGLFQPHSTLQSRHLSPVPFYSSLSCASATKFYDV